MRTSWKWVRGTLISAIILLVSLVGMRVMSARRQAPRRAQVQAQSLRVEVESVRRRATTLYLEGYGTTEAAKKVEIVPESSGKITYISPHFREGGRVRKGALLFQVDARRARLELRRLQHQLTSLGRQIALLGDALKLDRKNLSRNRKLYRRKAIDRGSYEAAKIRFLEREQRQENLVQSREATRIALENARLNLRNTRIYAPFDARVIKGDLQRGAFVSQGRGVGVLESRDAVDIPVSFSLDDLGRIRGMAGRRLDIEQIPSALNAVGPVEVWRTSEPGVRWSGRVIRVGGRVDLSTRTLPLWVRVSFKGHKQRRKKARSDADAGPAMTLLPGVFCRTRLPIRRLEQAVTIPRAALHGDVVYLMVDEKLARRRVEIAHQNENSVVLSGGLRDGEKLVLSALTDPIVGTVVSSNKPLLQN